ncbi:MAG: DNA polymerase III subunit gamma/tau [Bacteroidales bacterium]|nr:DNA polymerase III subunit gamma/tau [Bacteroidales bacterium]
MANYIVSARKYRPVSFDAVIGQSAVTATLRNAVRTGQIAHAYLFCGPRGVGKTTCARILARTLNCYNLDDSAEACGTCESCMAFNESRSFNIHELDAASNNSVDDIRSLIERVRIHPQVGKYSIYIIDEVHMLSQSAFNAFLKTLEEPPLHAIFILATTEKHKILPTILSRCQVFDFNRIRAEDIITYLMKIADSENVRYEKDALHVIAVKAEGSLRDALSIFDQTVSFTGNNITYKEVVDNLNVLNHEYYFRLTEAFLDRLTANALLIFDEILSKGFDGFHFIGGLSGHFRDLLVSHDVETIQLLEAGETMKDRYMKQASLCTPEFLFQALEICNQCEVGYKSSKNQRFHVELALIRLSNLNAEKKNLNLKKDQIFVPEIASSSGNKAKENARITEEHHNVIPKAIINEPGNKYTVSGKNISIKKALAAKPEEHTEGDQEPDEVGMELPEDHHGSGYSEGTISEEFLQMCWTAYADQIRKIRPRMSVALKCTRPEIFPGNRIRITLSNQAQLEEFNKNTRTELERFLQRELQNREVSVEISISETAEGDHVKLYTNDEKFVHMNKKNPVLSKLKETLNLELE